MFKRIITPLVLVLACAVASATVVVRTDQQTIGPIKMMNAINNGPLKSDKGGQNRDNFDAYRDAGIPYARTHDASFCSSYGGEHTVDITAIFPDFSKDENDPASYDFTMTDYYLELIRSAGTEVFFRLGQRIEHGKKKYGILPPADYGIWARICEHIIRHYNYGWADGYEWNIEYWEIWNEADNDENRWQTNPECWGGPKEEFFKFFSIAAGHLKKCFPELKIGGPAIAWNLDWGEELLQYLSSRKVGLDFFSFHCYTTDPSQMAARTVKARKLLDKYGYKDTETILNEWNYIKGWKQEYQYSIDVMNGQKGAAFVASAFCTLQDQPLDMLMYYDARPYTVFNGLFDFYDFAPTRIYYAFYAWGKLRDLGSQLRVETDDKDIYAVAASDGNRRAVFIARYNDDDNVVTSKNLIVDLGDKDCMRAVGHMTDHARIYTEIPVHAVNGVAQIRMEPNSFIMIEY